MKFLLFLLLVTTAYAETYYELRDNRQQEPIREWYLSENSAEKARDTYAVIYHKPWKIVRNCYKFTDGYELCISPITYNR